MKACLICRKPFTPRHPLTVTCSTTCSRLRRNRSDDYHRWKRSKRRSVTSSSDITPPQEADMRRRTRKCKICGIFLTGKPGKPNSKQLDHIIPINIGGTHTHGNVRIICRTCNLARPKDGSDYTGPVTLWAQAPGVVLRTPSKLSAKSKPVSRRTVGQCRCGKDYLIMSSRQLLCHACVEKAGQIAANLRNEGWKWKDIAAELDYPNLGSLRNLAVRYGVVTAPRYMRAA